MTDNDWTTDLEWPALPVTPPNPAAPASRKCSRHLWDAGVCARCDRVKDEAVVKRNKNNRKRGNAEELSVAKAIGGRKMGPLGLPWDVEMQGYARLQVKKLATPPSLRFIAAELARIGSGAEMPGFVWVEPGRGGERLITFRLADFADRHGLPDVEG